MLVLAVVGLSLVLTATVGAVSAAHAARVRSQGAADLAALAAASAARHGSEADACALAGRAAGRNGARLGLCVHEGGGVVRVQVERSTVLGPARAAARAGPASARDGSAATDGGAGAGTDTDTDTG